MQIWGLFRYLGSGYGSYLEKIALKTFQNQLLRELSPLQLQVTASVRERQLRATWALLLWPTWLAAAVREPMLLFVTERGFTEAKLIISPTAARIIDQFHSKGINTPFNGL